MDRERKILMSVLVLVAGLCNILNASASTSYSFQSFSGAPGTVTENINPVGINNKGQIVGQVATQGYSWRGFFYESNNFRILSDAYSNPIPGVLPRDINNNGAVVGTLNLNSSSVIIQSDGSYSEFGTYYPQPPYGVLSIGISSMNDYGLIVGNRTNNHLNTIYQAVFSIGFLYENGQYTYLDGLGGAGAVISKINNNGQIVGYSPVEGWTRLQSFIYSNGSYLSLTGPEGSITTLAQGINNQGDIVGAFAYSGVEVEPNQNSHGFVLHDGMYTLLDVPNAISTVATDINDLGQIVGYYNDNSGYYRGFIATPVSVPAPIPFWLFGSAILGWLGFGCYKSTSA
ncbi:MAG: hypothetical protein HOP23_03935 [Methylococcaceae bacterium]|nr:hypothetical protein [Methylococcaceae bacterium]